MMHATHFQDLVSTILMPHCEFVTFFLRMTPAKRREDTLVNHAVWVCFSETPFSSPMMASNLGRVVVLEDEHR